MIINMFNRNCAIVSFWGLFALIFQMTYIYDMDYYEMFTFNRILARIPKIRQIMYLGFCIITRNHFAHVNTPNNTGSSNLHIL